MRVIAILLFFLGALLGLQSHAQTLDANILRTISPAIETHVATGMRYLPMRDHPVHILHQRDRDVGELLMAREDICFHFSTGMS